MALHTAAWEAGSVERGTYSNQGSSSIEGDKEGEVGSPGAKEGESRRKGGGDVGDESEAAG